jgi:hypothetical protein
VFSTSGYVGLKFFNVIEAPSSTSQTSSIRSIKSSGSNSEQQSKKRSDVNTQLLGSIIGAICVGLATFMVFFYRMGTGSKPKKSGTKGVESGKAEEIKMKNI